MNINLKGTDVILTDEVRSYFDKCMHKVEKLMAKDPSAQVDAELQRHTSHDAGEEFRVEVTITGSGMQVRGEARDPSLHSAIDIVEGHLTQELRKKKGKRIDGLRRQAARFKNYLRGFRD